MRFSFFLLMLSIFSNYCYGQYSHYIYLLKLELPKKEIIFPKLPKKFDGLNYYTDSTSIYMGGKNKFYCVESFNKNIITNSRVMFTKHYKITINYKKPCIYFVGEITYDKKNNNLILGFYANRDTISNKYFNGEDDTNCFYNLIIEPKNDNSKMTIDYFIKTSFRKNTLKIIYSKGEKIDYGLLKKK